MLEATNTPSTASQQDDLTEQQKKQHVLSAAALGWSLIELLGRCFTLELPTLEKKLESKGWTGERMVIISPAFNSQKRLRALVCFIRSLVKKMQIDDENDNDIEMLVEAVEKLYQADSIDKALLGQINRDLFSWDTKIREKLQNKSEHLRNTYDYVNAYMVGKGFAALRWYLGKDGSLPREQDGTKIDERFLATLKEHVQLMAPYLCKFAPLALAGSLEHWGNPISKQEVHLNSRGEAPLELQRQADIWYDLLTAERDPTTYVIPSSVTWRYTLKVIGFSLPYVLLGVLLAAGITALVAYLIGDLWPPIAKTLNASTTVISTVTIVGTGFSLLAGIGTALPTVKALWQWVTQNVQVRDEPSVSTELSDAGRSLVNVFWEAAQQAAINKATCVKQRRMFPHPRDAQRAVPQRKSRKSGGSLLGA